MKVKCIDNQCYQHQLTSGKVYDVEPYNEDGVNYFKFTGDNGRENLLAYQTRFEVVENETKIKKVKTMKVKCVDNNGCSLLTIGKIYEAYRYGDFYRITDDEGKENMGYNISRFEVVKEKEKAVKKDRIYFRDNKGNFCTARQFFAESKQISSFITTNDFIIAERTYKELSKKYEDNKDKIALLVIGASSIREISCSDNNYLNISFYKNGEVTIQYNVDASGGSRLDILNRVYQKIESILSIQKSYMTQSIQTFVCLD